MRCEGREVMRRERSWSHRARGREVMKCEGREVMRREGQGHVTACAGSTEPLAFGEAAAPRGWTALSGVLVTRQGTDDLGLGAGDVGLVASPV